MAQPPFGQPTLAEQLAALQQGVDRQEKRRATDRHGRSIGGDYDGIRDTYGDGLQRGPIPAKQRHAANATGGLRLGSAAAAAAAVAAAGQVAGPALQRCELCAVTFGCERGMVVHLEGAAHRKALEQQAAEGERRRRLGAYADVAASAVAQGSWQGGQGRQQQQGQELHPAANPAAVTGGNATALGGRSRQGGGGSRGQGSCSGGGRGQGSGGDGGMGSGGRQQQQGQHRGNSAAAAAAAAAARARILTSHDEILRQARGDDRALLTIDGWVPPTVLPPAQSAQLVQVQQRQAGKAERAAQGNEENEGSGLILGPLVSYSDDEAAGTGSSSSSREGVGSVAAAGEQAAGGGGGVAAGPGGSADSDSSSNSSESDSEERQPSSFFSF